MSFLKSPDFFSIQQLAVDSTLLTAWVSEQFMNGRQSLSAMGKTFYNDSSAIAGTWYAAIRDNGAAFKNNFGSHAAEWYSQGSLNAKVLAENVQIFFSHPKQSADAGLAYLTDGLSSLVSQASLPIVERYQTVSTSVNSWLAQPLNGLKNGYQSVEASWTHLTDSASSVVSQATLPVINGYYTVSDSIGGWLEQPVNVLRNGYRNTLASAMDVYLDVLSSVAILF